LKCTQIITTSAMKVRIDTLVPTLLHIPRPQAGQGRAGVS
jgi:hypothetical protein